MANSTAEAFLGRIDEVGNGRALIGPSEVSPRRTRYSILTQARLLVAFRRAWSRPYNAERLMTPTAKNCGGIIFVNPPRGGFFVADVAGQKSKAF